MKSDDKRCLIIVGGEYAPLSEDICFDYVIACDKGYEYADQMGIRYDIVMGDFDSSESRPRSDVPVIELPKEKDDTDTVYAVKYALDIGFEDIHIICAFGGRLDHTIANLQTAAFIASKGARAHLYGKDNEVHAFRDTLFTIQRRKDSYISVFSLSDVSEGVTIEGTRYKTRNHTLTAHFPLGVSNEWADDTASISVGNGILAVVISKRN